MTLDIIRGSNFGARRNARKRDTRSSLSEGGYTVIFLQSGVQDQGWESLSASSIEVGSCLSGQRDIHLLGPAMVAVVDVKLVDLEIQPVVGPIAGGEVPMPVTCRLWLSQRQLGRSSHVCCC